MSGSSGGGKKHAWGDDDEDDELPSRTESAVDASGHKRITEYRLDSAGHRVKVSTVMKCVPEVSREPVAIKGRRERMKKFGAAASSVDETNVTIQVKDEERVTLDDDADEATAANVKEAMSEFARKQAMRKLRQKYQLEEDEDEDPAAAAADQSMQSNGGGVGGKAAYVPPSMRGKEGGQRMAAEDDRDNATLRVTNISEDTAEQDLQMLFSPYGRISRMYLAKDKGTYVSRGFAFISYHDRADAARAMEALQGHGFDHLILKIDWSKPASAQQKGDGGLSSGFTSGYGKALAQDTKERVSYASNLTANR